MFERAARHGYLDGKTTPKECSMPDPMIPADMPETDDAMPQGEALARAEDELDALAPGPADTLHFDPDTSSTQSIDEPVHDLLGRRDGP